MNADPQRVRSVFLAAVERGGETAFLDEACADDADLRREVEVLLRGHEQPNELLDGTLGPAGDAVGERPGMTVGPYKLLEQIGEGGFGVVFMAEQTQPVRRKVALKVLKPGMDTRQVVARFEAERQALALMDHPHIAHVFDGGETESGRPYFVMELVRGVTVTEFCDAHHLGVRERLGLFVDICSAVQHAHQKGIIHRDIKPSNVLVTMHDDAPVVKVIDFGIAKATGQSLTDKTLFTNFAQFVGTPLYMSPEQAQLSGLDIDTRTDIYSLGVLLYELLTGTTPFDEERLRSQGFDEVRRIIREEEPARPSTRMSTLGQAAATVSANRGSDPARLRRQLRGELDWIVMKALEKNRNRRYESAGSFAADVRRYLRDEPVQACPPSVGYRLGKFARRNKVALLAGSAVAVALVAGAAVATWQAAEAIAAKKEALDAAVVAKDAQAAAEKKAAETAAVLRFVETRVFAAARPEHQEGGLGRDVSLRKAVEAAVPFVEKSFPDEPLIEARLRLALGTSFYHLGEGGRSAEQNEKAHAVYAAQLGPDHPDTLKSLSNLAIGYDMVGRHADALRLREEVLMRRRIVLGPRHFDTASALNNLAISYENFGRHADALRLREEVMELDTATLGPDHPDTLRSTNNLANSYAGVGRFADALRLQDEVLAKRKTILGPDHPDTLLTMSNRATSLADLDRHPEALPVREEVLARQRAALGPDHPQTLVSLGNLAVTYAALGRHADALALRHESVERRRNKLGPDHVYTLRGMCALAESLIELNRGVEAVPFLDECIQRAASQPTDPRVPQSAIDLRLKHFRAAKDIAGCRATAELWEKLDRTDAEGLYVAARLWGATAGVSGSADDAERALGWLNKAVAAGFHDADRLAKDRDFDALRGRPDFPKAAAPPERKGGPRVDVSLRRAIDAAAPFVATSFAAEPLVEARLRMTLGQTYYYLGEPALAEGQYRKARELYAQHSGPEHPDTLRAMHQQSNGLEAMGKRDDALRLRQVTVDAQARTLGPDDADTLRTTNNLANSLADLGRHDEAIRMHLDTLDRRQRRLGDGHDDTLQSKSNLSISYHALGRFDDARALREELLTARRARLGPDHPETLLCMNNLANTYMQLKRHDDSLALHQQALALKKTSLGPDHPDTLTSMQNLATTLSAMGRKDEALTLREETLELQKRKQGPDHPDTLKTMHNLSTSYQQAGRVEEALAMRRDTWERRKAALGVNHPDTLDTLSALAGNLFATGRNEEGVQTIDECLRLAEGREVGPRLVPGLVNRRLRYFERAGDAAGCRATAEIWERLGRTDADSLFVAARIWGATAGVSKASADADRAMVWLNKSFAAGYGETGRLAKDRDFDALRGRADFQQLAAKVVPGP